MAKPQWLKVVRACAANRTCPAFLSNMSLRTGVPMQSGFIYLVAVMDWRSRFVLAWGLEQHSGARYSRP